MSFLSVIFLSCFAICVVVWKFRCSYPNVCTAPYRIQDFHKAKQILGNSSLKSRARPNQRLVMAFGIDNAFTTCNPSMHMAFVANVKVLLRTTDSEWMELANLAANMLNKKQDQVMGGDSIILAKLVQVFVFRIVLKKFFPTIQNAYDADIELITTSINSLWIASKSCGNFSINVSTESKDKITLFNALYRVFGVQVSVGKDNPLNIILPAYETLWRVVLCFFIEIRFRNKIGTPVHSFDAFLLHPTQKSFEARDLPHMPSVRDIVSETLRLYPPTRRVYRDEGTGVVAIDVEYMHRDEDHWGRDAEEFDPTRWLRGQQGLGFLPFGMGRFECPAKAIVGPMMVGILAGTLVQGLNKGWDLHDDEGEIWNGQLDRGRGGLEGLRLKKMGN
jgi:hypothetical protein